MAEHAQIIRCPHCGRLEYAQGAGAGPIPLGWSASPRVSLGSAAHNLREVCKELVLLERHFLCGGEYCPDCITKHFLTAEALTQEAGTLTGAQEWAPTIASLAEYVGELERGWLAGRAPDLLGQRCRALRKALAPRVFASG